MAPDEVQLLQHVGQTFLQNISVTVTQSILYGLYLAIFAFGIRALLRRQPRTKYTWILFGCLSILFLFTTVNLVIGVAFTVSLTRGDLINNPAKPLLNRILLTDDSLGTLNIVLIWFGGGGGGSGSLFILADAVVVWRACVLWPGNGSARLILLSLLLISFLFSIVSGTLESISFAKSNTIPVSSPAGITMTLSQSLSLATNLLAIVFIGYKAYQHRQIMKSSLGVKNSKAGAILLFLTESGIAFCILQLVTFATALSDNTAFTTLDYAAKILGQITLFAATAYPILVLIIVDSHRSISDHTGSACDSGNNTGSLGAGSHISFAARPPGLSSTSDGIGADSMVGSPNGRGDHSDDRSVHFKDLEKADGSSGALPAGHL